MSLTSALILVNNLLEFMTKSSRNVIATKEMFMSKNRINIGIVSDLQSKSQKFT
jgi:hypothetical protein